MLMSLKKYYQLYRWAFLRFSFFFYFYTAATKLCNVLLRQYSIQIQDNFISTLATNCTNITLYFTKTFCTSARFFCTIAGTSLHHSDIGAHRSPHHKSAHSSFRGSPDYNAYRCRSVDNYQHYRWLGSLLHRRRYILFWRYMSSHNFHLRKHKN